MRLICGFAILGAASAASAESFEDIARSVNSNKRNTWVAEVPKRFASPGDEKPFLGAYLPGHPLHQAPPLKKIVENNEIPESFDAREKWTKCGGMKEIRDQSACGSCWAFASTDSFQDRACAASGKDIRRSAEDTAFCSTAGNGCDGGSSAWNWFQQTGVATGGSYDDIGKGDTCMPYTLKPCAHHIPPSAKYAKCPQGDYPSPQCTFKCSESKYNTSYNSDKGMATGAYSLNGIKQIQTDLMNKGPLYVAFTVYSDFSTYKSGVYHHTTDQSLGGHAVELIGWGTESGTDYWLIKNSWNQDWGLNGTFKIVRGTNECGIEDDVNGGTVSSSPGPSPPPGPPVPGNCEDQATAATCEHTTSGGTTCQWCFLRGIKMGMCQEGGSPCQQDQADIVV